MDHAGPDLVKAAGTPEDQARALARGMVAENHEQQEGEQHSCGGQEEGRILEEIGKLSV